MADAVYVRQGDQVRVNADAAVSAGECWQMPDGRAAYCALDPLEAASSGDQVDFVTSGTVTMTKVTGVVLLEGNRAYWDHSANNITYKKVNDRDFYVGRVQADAASTDLTVQVALNVDPRYDIDLVRDGYVTVPTGTQALGGFLPPQNLGGVLQFALTSTNEAQKVDALSLDGFAKGAMAIVEGAFRVASDGAGTVVDVSMGLANDTHATDADSITESLFVHLDANNTNINLESDDGTTEVAATDTTTDYTEGSTISQRVEFWFDLRNNADIQCYVNGALVLGSTVFKLDAATGPLKLLVHVEKTSSTDTYTLVVDWLRVRFAEQRA